MVNPCVFCSDDSARLTDEHVFADWITDFYAERAGKLPYGTVEIGTSSGEPRQFRTVPFQQVVKIVCAKCNNGWMASLEGRVKPYLSKMLVGQDVRLRSNAQRDLARWCLKTVMVMEHFSPKDPLIPKAHYRDLYQAGAALPNNFIVISSRMIPRHDEKGLHMVQIFRDRVIFAKIAESLAGGDQRLAQDWMSQQARDGRVAYKVTFAVGNFVAQVFGHDLPVTAAIAGNGPAIPIWPDVRNRIDWSMDKYSVDQVGGLLPFHRMFAAPPPGANVPPDYFTRATPFQLNTSDLLPRNDRNPQP
jgi:hypothetical protein